MRAGGHEHLRGDETLKRRIASLPVARPHSLFDVLLGSRIIDRSSEHDRLPQTAWSLTRSTGQPI